MNLFEKLAEIRTKISVEKTGNNSFAKYKYYEIDVIYHKAKKLFQEYKIFTYFQLQHIPESNMFRGSLTVINAEKPDEKFTLNFDSGLNELKGAMESQKAGANQTYSSKYLYLSLLMLDDGASDPDAVNEHEEPETPKVDMVTNAQLKKIWALGNGITNFKDFLYKSYNISSGKELTKAQAVKLIETMEKDIDSVKAKAEQQPSNNPS